MTNSTPFNSINPKRLIVVDPSLTDFVGHHAQYDISVIESAEVQGMKGVVLSHKLVSGTIDKQVPIVRAFSEDMWGRVRSYKLGTLELILLLRGIIACLLLPIFAKRHLAGLKRWISTVYRQRPKILRNTETNNSFLKFLIYVIINSVPSGFYSVAYLRKTASRARRLFALLSTPPAFYFFLRVASNASPKLGGVIKFFLPPILFINISITSILVFPFKLGYGFSRFFTPRIIVALAKGFLEKIRIANSFGKLPLSIILFAFENPRYYFEATAGLASANLAEGDLVFFHMVIGRNILETAALCEMIHAKTGISPVVLLRYPPNFLNSIHPALHTLAIRKLEYLFEAGKVRIASDSDRLIDDYCKVTYIPFELFPIPHGAGSRQISKVSARKDDRVNITSLGNARGEKGFIEIFSLMRRIATSELKSKVRFIIQANDPDGDAAPYVAKLRKTKFPFPVQVITNSLDKNAYEELVASSDIVLAPYWREIYASRTSGVAVEVIVAGKILITTEDTWMADQVHLWKSGLTVKNRNFSDLTKAVMRAVTNFSALTIRSHAASQAAAHFHSGHGFIDHILRRKIARALAHKEICFLYPWGNLFQYNSGASVRSSLLVKKIISAGWRVAVIGDQLKLNPGTLPKGARIIPYSDSGSSFRNPLYLADYIQRLIFTPRMIGLEDMQYRFRFWCRSRSFKMLLNTNLRYASAVILEYEFLASLVRPFATAHHISMTVDAHDVLGMQTNRKRVRSFLIKQQVEALKLSDFPCCISDEDRVFFESQNVSPCVIENSIDLDAFALPTRSSAIDIISKAGYRLPEGQFGLFIGSPHPPNFSAVRSIAKLSTNQMLRQKRIGFVVVGGCFLPELPNESQSFIQLGFVSSEVLRAVYALASFVIAPLESGTGSSIKTLEAFGYGKVVIGTSLAFRGIPATDGHDCIVVNRLDEYPARIVKLLNETDAIPILEKNARTVAAKRDYRITYQPIIDVLDKWQTNCPICRSIGPKKFFVKEGRELLICRDCRHIFWSQMPSAEELSSFYSSLYTQQHGQEAVQTTNIEYYRQHAIELLIKNKGTTSCIADVGCSIPLFLEQALSVGFHTAIGVDHSYEARDYGKRCGVEVLSPSDFDKIETESLDVLRYSHSLEHMVDPVGNLIKASKKVRTGGLIYITQPNFPVFKFSESAVAIKDSVWPNHLHFFNPISLKCMIEMAGLELISFCTVTEEQNAGDQYDKIIDISYSSKVLQSLKAIGENERGSLNNYPYYFGENSVVYARKIS